MMTGTHDDIATLLNDVVSCRPHNLRAYSKVILKRAIEIADGYADYMKFVEDIKFCLLYTSPSPRDATLSRMPSSA